MAAAKHDDAFTGPLTLDAQCAMCEPEPKLWDFDRSPVVSIPLIARRSGCYRVNR